MRRCNKIWYLSRREARGAARWYTGRSQHPYYCEVCGGWHLTSMSRQAGKLVEKERRIRRRERERWRYQGDEAC